MSKPNAKRRYRARRRRRAVEHQRERNSSALFSWLWQRSRAGVRIEVAPFGILPYVDHESGRVTPVVEMITCATCNGDGETLIALHDAQAGQPVACEPGECPECSGKGLVRADDLCPTCRGNGCTCAAGQWCGACIPF